MAIISKKGPSEKPWLDLQAVPKGSLGSGQQVSQQGLLLWW